MKDEIVSKISNLKLLKSGIIIPALTELFDPEKKFLKNKKVKYSLEYNFKKYLLKGIKSFSNLSEASLDKLISKEIITDTDIMFEIDVSVENGLLSKEEILYRISYLTELQPKGGEGILSCNAEVTIVGYFKCDDGQIRVVGVSWSSFCGMWGCTVDGLGYWNKGREVLSNSNGILKS